MPESADFAIGQPAADGKFSFVVNGVDCSQTQIGNEFLNPTAQGQFCVVDLAITNIGNEPQSFLGEFAMLTNAQGQGFSADTEAAIYLENSSSLYEEINPGNTLNSKVVFDVPAGMVPAAIELHDSMFSGGAPSPCSDELNRPGHRAATARCPGPPFSRGGGAAWGDRRPVASAASPSHGRGRVASRRRG